MLDNYLTMFNRKNNPGFHGLLGCLYASKSRKDLISTMNKNSKGCGAPFFLFLSLPGFLRHATDSHAHKASNIKATEKLATPVTSEAGYKARACVQYFPLLHRVRDLNSW